MKNGIAFLVANLFSVVAMANPATLAVRACDETTPTSVEFLAGQKTFSNGNIRVFAMDTYGEPVCCSTHLVIYIPAKDEPMSSRCFHVASDADGMGFLSVDLNKAKATYDAKKGLTIQFPFSFYNDEGDGGFSKTFSLLINQANETVQVLK